MRSRVAAMAAITLVAAACGGGAGGAGGAGGGPIPENAVTVNVTNNAFSDMDVYAMSPGGYADWLGLVTGNSSQTLRVPPGDGWSGVVRLIAHPIGGRGVARSGAMLVGASGGQINFTIQDPLGTSYATVASAR